MTNVLIAVIPAAFALISGFISHVFSDRESKRKTRLAIVIAVITSVLAPVAIMVFRWILKEKEDDG